MITQFYRVVYKKLVRAEEREQFLVRFSQLNNFTGNKQFNGKTENA